MEEISRIPPNSEEAELCVLGSILIDNDAVLAVSEFLKAEHFYNSNYGKIYQSMMDLYEERMPLDLVTVSEKLKELPNNFDIYFVNFKKRLWHRKLSEESKRLRNSWIFTRKINLFLQ